METIAAIATPPGRGGVGIVRLSGAQSYAIACQLSSLSTITPRMAYYRSFYLHPTELIDQGILIYFKAPHSFTGEDVVEFQIHGSPVVLDTLLQACIRLGARIAKPGEFSERAFLNDKMDLTQAEAIADLIDASSQTAARMALRSLQGDFSHQIHELSEHVIHLRLYVEAAIDFPDEEIDFLSDGVVLTKLQTIIHHLTTLKHSATQGMMMSEGLSIVIAGRPNAGKSTLINQLAGSEIAIVTEIAGTTRDVMRAPILLDDIPLHLIDTAGLRESNDVVEQEGIRRAWQEVERADCVLHVMDVQTQQDHHSLNEQITQALPKNIHIIQVFNKIDAFSMMPKVEENSVYLSAKTGLGLDLLKEKIKKTVGFQPTEGNFLARRRHLDALDTAQRLLTDGQAQLVEHRAGELLAEDLRLAHEALCSITGEFSSDDLLGKIFSSFCIGK